MSITLKINGLDVSELLEEKGYSVSEIKVFGPNGGTSLSGETWEDLIAYKDKVSIPLEPLSDEALFTIMDRLRNSESAPYVQLYYLSPNYGEYRESKFIREEITHTHMFTSDSGTDYYNKNTLVFTEA